MRFWAMGVDEKGRASPYWIEDARSDGARKIGGSLSVRDCARVVHVFEHCKVGIVSRIGSPYELQPRSILTSFFLE